MIIQQKIFFFVKFLFLLRCKEFEVCYFLELQSFSSSKSDYWPFLNQGFCKRKTTQSLVLLRASISCSKFMIVLFNNVIFKVQNWILLLRVKCALLITITPNNLFWFWLTQFYFVCLFVLNLGIPHHFCAMSLVSHLSRLTT